MRDDGRRRWLIPAGIGLAVVVLVVVAVVREPVELDPATPEGTVQVYLQAIGDEDYEQALSLLEPNRFEECTVADISRFAPNESFTATLDETSRAGADTGSDADSKAFVDVTMRFGTDGLFGSSWESFESFTLLNDDGFWWITDDPWPHFGWECGAGETDF